MGLKWWILQLALPIVIVLAIIYMETMHIIGVYPL